MTRCSRKVNSVPTVGSTPQEAHAVQYLVADCLVLLKHVGHHHQLGAQLLGMAALRGKAEHSAGGPQLKIARYLPQACALACEASTGADEGLQRCLGKPRT